MNTVEELETKKVDYKADGTGEDSLPLRKVLLSSTQFSYFLDPSALRDHIDDWKLYVNAYIRSRYHFELEERLLSHFEHSIKSLLPEIDIYLQYMLLNRLLITEPPIRPADTKTYEEEKLRITDWNQVVDFFREKISKIPEVRGAFGTVEDEQVCIWTIIDEKDKEIRPKIYDIEMELMEHFTNISFDFHVVFCSLKDVKKEVPPGSKLIYTR